MKTSELLVFLKNNDVTKDQGYNILIEDIWNLNLIDKEVNGLEDGVYHKITEEDMEKPVAQAIIKFFMYQVQEVLLPVITDLRKELNQVQHAGQVFKDELDTRDASLNRILKTEADVYLNNRIDGALGMIESQQNQIDSLRRFQGRIGA